MQNYSKQIIMQLQGAGNLKFKIIALLIFALGLLCFATDSLAAVCGNGDCEAGETKENCRVDCDSVFKANINKFRDFPVHGNFGGLIGDNLNDKPEDIINDNSDTKLNAAISIYKTYNFNTVYLSATLLYDDLGNLTERGKVVLAKLEQAKIKVILNFWRDAYSEDYKTQVKNFMKTLDEYRNINPAAYSNILAYFIGDDVFGYLSERIDATRGFAQYIRNEIYKADDFDANYAINRQLDIPLMIDCGGVSGSTRYGDLSQDIEIIGGYEYNFLIGKNSHNLSLKTMTNRLNGAGVNTDDRFFTVLQAHNMFWYNATFHNTDDYNLNLPVGDKSDVYPEGIQSASLIYQSLRNNTKHYLFYNRPNLINDPNNFSQDRLAEIGIANKLVDILWEPVLKNSTLNTNIEKLFDATGVFEGNVLNFEDSRVPAKKGALLVINANKSNNIFGKAASEVGKNVTFSQYSKNDSTYSLIFSALGIEKRADAATSLKVKQIDFPGVKNVTFTLSNNENIKLTIPSPGATTSAINENTFILMTYDDTIVTAINNALQDYKTPDNRNIAKRLACEALDARLTKTFRKLDEIGARGFSVKAYGQRLEAPQGIVDNSTFDSIKCYALTQVTYRDLRNEISKIGDLQVEIYNDITGTNNPDNLYEINNKRVYPNGNAYCDNYWDLGQDYKDFIIPKLRDCEPQKLNFYLLDKYLDCKNSKFNYIDSVSAASIQNSSSATISWTTYKPASSQVAYRKAADSIYTTTPIEDQATKVESHTVTLNPLLQNSKYYYYVKSLDQYNNELLSSVYTFTNADTTPPASPSGLQVQ
jgi:hypothetical protein